MFPLFGWSVWLQSVARRPAGARRTSADWMESNPARRVLLVALAPRGGSARIDPRLVRSAASPNTSRRRTRTTWTMRGNLTVVSRAAYLHAVAAQEDPALPRGDARLHHRRFLRHLWRLVTAPAGARRCAGCRGPRAPDQRSPSRRRSRRRRAGRDRCRTHNRISAWSGHEIYLHAGRPVAANLAPGQYAVFAGCTQDMTCAHLDPSSVTIRNASHEVHIVPDRAPDPRDSEGDGQPFVGELSFSIPPRQCRADRADARSWPAGLRGPLRSSRAYRLVRAPRSPADLIVSLIGLGRLAWSRNTGPAPFDRSRGVPRMDPRAALY